MVLAALIVAHGSSNAVAHGVLRRPGLWMTILQRPAVGGAFFLVGLEMPLCLDARLSDQIPP